MDSQVEDALYCYVTNRLSQEQIRQIHTENDLFATMEDDDIEEIKDELWNIVVYSRWKRLLEMIQDLVLEEEEEEEEDYEKESDSE